MLRASRRRPVPPYFSFEAFIAEARQPAYHSEFNFAPSGEWAIYAFRGYRDGGPLADESMRPQIAVSSNDRQLELDTMVRLDSLPGIYAGTALRIGLSAVVEASDGRSYWALHHPLDRPDFHHADGFALTIEPDRSEPDLA